MNQNISGTCFLLVFLMTLVSCRGDPLLPYDRMEKASILLHLWNQWYDNQPWDESEQVDNSDVNSACDNLPTDSLRAMYYTRIRFTIDRGEHRERDTERDEYKMIQNIAKHISFYETKLGSPPLKDSNRFYRASQILLEADERKVKKQGELFWISDSELIVCQNGKYVECKDATIQDLKEACDLQIPPEEEIDPPSEGQLYLIELLKKLKDYESSEFRQPLARFEGQNCTAPPNTTIAFIATSTKFKVKPPDEVNTYAEYEKTMRGVRELDSDLPQWKSILDDFKLYHIKNLIHCKYEFSDDERFMARTGGLVCGGNSCKLCIEYPEKEGELQSWNYKQGPLHKACRMAFSLKTIREEDPPDGPVREPCKGFNTCPSENTNCMDYDFTEPAFIQYKTNADRWRVVANSQGMINSRRENNNKVWVSSLFVLLVPYLYFALNFL